MLLTVSLLNIHPYTLVQPIQVTSTGLYDIFVIIIILTTVLRRTSP